MILFVHLRILESTNIFSKLAKFSRILSEIIKWLASSSIKKPIRQQQNVMRHGSLTVEEFEKNKKAKKYPLYSLIDKYPRSTSFVIKSLQSKSRYKLYRPKTCQDDNSGSLLE